TGPCPALAAPAEEVIGDQPAIKRRPHEIGKGRTAFGALRERSPNQPYRQPVEGEAAQQVACQQYRGIAVARRDVTPTWSEPDTQMVAQRRYSPDMVHDCDLGLSDLLAEIDKVQPLHARSPAHLVESHYVMV